MKIFSSPNDFIIHINSVNTLNIIYGAGWAGLIVSRFLKLKGILVDYFAETNQIKNWKLEGITVKCLDDIINEYRLDNINIILAVRALNLSDTRAELKKRNISHYIEVTEILQYEMIKELLKDKVKKVKLVDRLDKYQKTIGYLSTEYLGSGYAQERLIINKVKKALYIELPWEPAEIDFIEKRYEKDITPYRQNLEACYSPQKYLSSVDLIHTFNTVCDTNISWCVSFETIVPRVFPETENEKKYYIKLVKYIKKDNCKTLYAFCKNAYKIQEHTLKSYIPLEDVKVLMKKTKVLHPPQKVLITEEKFKEKHNVKEIQFIFVGRAFFTKGGRECIEVLSEFEDRYKFKLTLISSMVYDDYFTKTSYDEMMRCKKIIEGKKWIDYYTSLSNEDVLKKCQNATVGLLPSVAETYGYAVLEMQASGCPVVTTNIRAFPEINNDECGWICQIPVDELGRCKEKDSRVWSELLSQELRKCFENIFKNPKQIKEKGKKAIDRIREMHDPVQYQNELIKNLL